MHRRVDIALPARQSDAVTGDRMMVARPQAEPGGISIGRVFERGFGALAANWQVMLGIAIVCALPNLVFAAAMPGVVNSSMGVGGAGVALWVTSMLLYIVSHGAIVAATIAHGDGGGATARGAIGASVRVMLPMIGAFVMIFVALMIGFVLFVIPGVYLWVRWSVATPALVAEREGALAALGRSRALTRGAWWPVFGLQLVVLIAYYAVVGTVGYGSIVSTGGTAAMLRVGATTPIAFQVTATIVGAVANAAWSAIQTALYIELRDWKDGPSADRLADVFA